MARKTRLSRRRSAPKAQPVKTVKPDPLVWAAALRLAHGNAARLRTLDDGSVLVQNHEGTLRMSEGSNAVD